MMILSKVGVRTLCTYYVHFTGYCQHLDITNCLYNIYISLFNYVCSRRTLILLDLEKLFSIDFYLTFYEC